MRLLLLALSFTAVLAVAPSADPTGQGNLVLVAAIGAALTIAAVLAISARNSIRLVQNTFAGGPVAAERRLHGAFRRASNPDTPGRPRPRAPGDGSRPA